MNTGSERLRHCPKSHSPHCMNPRAQQLNFMDQPIGAGSQIEGIVVVRWEAGAG